MQSPYVNFSSPASSPRGRIPYQSHRLDRSNKSYHRKANTFVDAHTFTY